jgi:hypothetical protein
MIFILDSIDSITKLPIESLILIHNHLINKNKSDR